TGDRHASGGSVRGHRRRRAGGLCRRVRQMTDQRDRSVRSAAAEPKAHRVDVVSIFPSYFDGLTLSLLGKARESGILDLHVHDLRDWTSDRHRTVDDTPYGGGAGMVMKPEPWALALDDLTARSA